MMPSDHKGFTEKRRWYKIRWTKNPHPDRKEWNNIEGKTDLMMQEDYDNYKDCVEIMETVTVPMCTTAPVLRFGTITDDAINDWIKTNTGK